MTSQEARKSYKPNLNHAGQLSFTCENICILEYSDKMKIKEAVCPPLLTFLCAGLSDQSDPSFSQLAETLVTANAKTWLTDTQQRPNTGKLTDCWLELSQLQYVRLCFSLKEQFFQ